MIEINFLIKVLCIVLVITTFGISFSRNKDIFSPIKVIALFNVVFYLDFYISSYGFEESMVYLFITSVISIFSFIEPSLNTIARPKKISVNNNFFLLIWIVSIVSILNQVSAIYELGGVVNYLGNLSQRVKYYEGRGYVIVLNNIIATLNVVYFSALLINNNTSKLKVLLFLVHFVFFVVISLISGSRSFLLMTLLVHLIAYNYLKSPIKYQYATFVFVLLMLSAAFLGAVRNNMSSDGVLSNTTSDTEVFELMHFRYGLIPLEIVFNAEDKELLYGSTYLSLFTNFIPRGIYPNKLDSGGIAFTKLYADDRWGGLSNLATGAITEGIINFGYEIGVVFGLFLMVIVISFSFSIYLKLMNNISHDLDFILKLILYLYFLLLASRFSYSEFSYILFTYVLFYAFPICLIKFLYRRWV